MHCARPGRVFHVILCRRLYCFAMESPGSAGGLPAAARNQIEDRRAILPYGAPKCPARPRPLPPVTFPFRPQVFL